RGPGGAESPSPSPERGEMPLARSKVLGIGSTSGSTTSFLGRPSGIQGGHLSVEVGPRLALVGAGSVSAEFPQGEPVPCQAPDNQDAGEDSPQRDFRIAEHEPGQRAEPEGGEVEIPSVEPGPGPKLRPGREQQGEWQQKHQEPRQGKPCEPSTP